MSRFTDRYHTRFSLAARVFIPFTVLGYPDRWTSFNFIRSMIEGGAHALELGIAFSDPTADGPTVQNAACETISSGFTTFEAFELIRRVREFDSAIPITLLVYYNTILACGPKRFAAKAKAAGADGVTIVDLPPDSGAETFSLLEEAGLKTIFIVSTLSSDERLERILARAGGFIYLVSRSGITGSHSTYDESLACMFARLKSRTSLPVCVGFGISSPDNARAMFASGADGVITGSALLELAAQSGFDQNKIRDFVESMVASC